MHGGGSGRGARARRRAGAGRFTGPYDAFDQTAFLAYLDAPDVGADLTRPPRLRISFGGRSYAVVMDTGSTGIVVSADKIPNIDRLQSLGPGGSPIELGRIMMAAG